MQVNRENATKSLPLSGVRVLALEQAVAGPLCTRHLCDLGADVIKVERTSGGDFARRYDTSVRGMSSYFVWLNRGKRSLSLDMKHSSATEILRRLLKSSDVLVQNLGPGAIDRLGFSPATLRQDFPKLVVCTISGYGSSGPFQNRKAFDLLLQGETGVIATTGTEEEPAKVGISVGDIGAAVYGTIAVLAGLYQRQETGAGQLVGTSLFDALAEWMGYPSYFTLYGGEPPIRAGVRHATVLPYGSYRCGDGQQVNLAVQTEDQWTSFCTVVCERPEWLADERYDSLANRRINRQQLESAIEEALAPLSRKEVTRRLEVADVPYGDVNTVQQFLEHPQLSERDRWRQIESPVGPLDAILPPFTFENAESAMGGIPDVGQHTHEVLAELGYSESEIATFKTLGAV